MVLDDLAQGRIRALGADPSALELLQSCVDVPIMRDALGDRGEDYDYTGAVEPHELSLDYSLLDGEWYLECSCGCIGYGRTLAAAVDAWNALARTAALVASNVVPLRRSGGES